MSELSEYLQSMQEMFEAQGWKNLVKEAEEAGEEKPQVSNYIGECILKIANHLSYKPNFINYTYRDEMIADGIENCIMYFRNFDPDKSKNPFAYFTQIIYYAFLRRIMREKKQLYVKYKATQQFGLLDEGEMYEVESQGVSLKTTLNHRMWIQRRGKETYELVEAKEIVGKRVRYQCDGPVA